MHDTPPDHGERPPITGRVLYIHDLPSANHEVLHFIIEPADPEISNTQTQYGGTLKTIANP